MAAESTVAGDVIDQRLDALDRALLGLLPRSERLAMVADVEARVRDGQAVNPALAELLASPAENTPAAEIAASRSPRRARRRSGLALTSGVIGIVALVLLFIMPLTYILVAMTSEVLGEITVYLLLSANIVVVALGGAAAVVMGITALVRLSRRQGQQVGHGWAITALCTGPLPALVGGLATITMAVPMLAEVAGNYGRSSGPHYVSGEGCAVCPAPDYASPATAASPAWVAAAPPAPYPPPASSYGLPAGAYPASPAPVAAPSYQPSTTPPAALAPGGGSYAAPAAPVALPASNEGTAPAAETGIADPTDPTMNPVLPAAAPKIE
jgi:hypothetical protein